MPIYEYTCQDCQHEFEDLVFDGDEVVCPKCQGKKLEKKWSVPARPRAAASSPCSNPDVPPCGPACGRWPG